MVHRIDEESPLWRMSPQDLQNSSFEIIVVLEGIVEPTGNTTQVTIHRYGDTVRDSCPRKYYILSRKVAEMLNCQTTRLRKDLKFSHVCASII